MISQDEFAALAELGYNRIPVAREIFSDLDKPLTGYLNLADVPYTYLLESVGGGEAGNCVDLAARVTAFLQERRFTEGAEVKAGDLLYRLERGPFEATVAQQQAQAAQNAALLGNATIQLTLPRNAWMKTNPNVTMMIG